MPRTASSQVQSRTNTKARPSANVRAGNLVANTPVLFRLPAIPTAPAEDLAVTFSEAVASLPTATLAAVTTTQQAAPMQAAPMQATQPASEVSVTPQAAPQQTWWEHWSSGIVLIVLLIALATASILAWQGSSKGNSKLMADTKDEAESQSDLSNISVPKLDNPKLELPKVEMPVSTKSNSYVEKLESPSAHNNALTPKSDDTDSSLIPSGSLSLTLDPPADNETKLEPQAEPYATASLNPPVVKPQEPLFKDNELTQSKSGLSAQPASTATQRNAANSDKPALWDSSKANGHDASKPLTLEFSSDDSSSLGNSSTSARDSATESPTASAKLISQTSADTTNTIASPASATLVPKDLQTAVKTVTPEMDQAELFAAYRELKAPTAPAKVDNRYGSTAAAGTQTQMGTPNGTQASVVGYTQQPTQTNSQPTSNNYTLQPAQNYAGNASQNPAQYSTQQFQNPQYSTQQNPTQQYSGQQLPGQQVSGQQFSAQQNPALPQYSTQPQPGIQNPNGLQLQGVPNQPSTGAQGLQYGGAQVPYNMQPAQGQSLQLPGGPIGGYGAATTAPTNRPTNGTANLSSPTSPNYPSLR